MKEAGVIDSMKSAASQVYDKSRVLGSSLVERSRELVVRPIQQSDSLRNVTDRIGEFGHRAFESASSTIEKIRGKEQQSTSYQTMDYEQEEMMTLDEMMQRDREHLVSLQRAEQSNQSFNPLNATRPMGEVPDLLSDFEPRSR